MRTRFHLDRGLIIVTATITGPGGSWRTRAMLDTGASRTMVGARVVEQLGFEVRDEAVAPLLGISGRVDAPIVRAHALAALGLRRVDHPVLAHRLPSGLGFEVLLGIDFLRGYRTCIDLGARIIDIEPAAPG